MLKYLFILKKVNMEYQEIQLKTVTPEGDILIDMADDINNPCQSCGACCSHFRISFYQGECDSNQGVVPTDMVIPITPYYVAMLGVKKEGDKPKTETAGQGLRCVALVGEIGKSSGCSIYHNRPTPCRAFPVWEEDGTPNPKCQELRAKIGLKALPTLIVSN
jgi:Fe-S-cluster containining protein